MRLRIFCRLVQTIVRRIPLNTNQLKISIMKTKEQIKELAYKRYGTDPHSFGGQRDGFREGYRMCQEFMQKTESDNNGWIKIESDKDIKICYCSFITKKGNTYLGKCELIEGEYIFINGVEGFTSSFITHYQQIIKPRDPLY